ncbi:hypothetical protein EO244_06340 [Ancylomarina salipaludis]|uniref:Uncharacterized protein n=1 Tax=Ancylomarina salipaludis TaxID=2501299 RepID=A0A4Q1JMU5_9BACT|nr:hypothetical protein [Ancylomarina salipaludis]RXQ95918.1 hypothetical protein EO244_06340 [Ancylomarina salipaludis]
MLKKISHIILALLILVTTMGMTVSAHYCGGKLKSVQVLTTSDSCCGVACDSCHNEIIQVKIKDDFSISSFTVDFTSFPTVLPALIQLFQDSIYTDEVEQIAYCKPPPLKIQRILSDLQVYRL